MKLTKKHMIFLLLFTVIALLADKVNFSKIIGADNQFFTLYQFFGPIAGAFLGYVLGPLSVLLKELISFFIMGKAFTVINIFRLFPMMFAAFYFGLRKEGKKLGAISYLVPIICMALFMLHPIGGQAWFYSLYWLIPIIGKFKWFRNIVFMRSLGATFTAHAIGSTAFLYATSMAAEIWVELIPVVLYERVLFSLGITFSYIIANTVLDKLAEKVDLSALVLDKRYVLSRYITWVRGI